MDEQAIRELPKVALGVRAGRDIDPADLSTQLDNLAAQNVVYAEFIVPLSQFELFDASTHALALGLVAELTTPEDVRSFLEGKATGKYSSAQAAEIPVTILPQVADDLRKHYVPFSVVDPTGAGAAAQGAHRIVGAMDIAEDFVIDEDDVLGDIAPGTVSGFIRDRGIPVALKLEDADLLDHPLPLLHSMGFNSVLYTNDPTGDLLRLATEAQYELEGIVALLRMTVEATFLPQPERQRLLGIILAPFNEDEEESESSADSEDEVNYELSAEEMANIDPGLWEMLGIDPSSITVKDDK
ncbi:MAG: hypothetical protein Q3962_09230 [Corynebacterium sp.]|nr:hypothetical protein [Corynebacterium sp.]